ncbi:MAG: Rieske (2Fe-2S) protein, partial [Acidobacteriota bacterium]|nr:Rieske (2Fe-2S) protein [Acidobacteriota bacterium]
IEGAEALLPGSSLYFTYPTRNDPALLVRAFDGEYYAYNQKCSHRGCSIYFNQANRRLECPCHKGTYDVRSGEVVMGPPPRPLEQIVLQVRGGNQVWAVGKRSYSGTATLARGGR